ncbi:jg8373 [Pararge aegeria aegeria]|uniref:Jg8373 protein n=1 Tax=Pararge aegeria aegeria TaxID=348720 RepID=A0A8S4SNS4_9NEOP|nr:jg8373 [Pararge aegeria aegeria]
MVSKLSPIERSTWHAMSTSCPVSVNLRRITFERNRNGNTVLMCDGWTFRMNRRRDSNVTAKQRWRCSRFGYCKAAIHTIGDVVIKTNLKHNH